MKESSPGTPVWSHGGIVCTGETYKNVVKMTFAKGAALKDPSGLFNSSLDGNVRRAIDIHEGDKVDEAALKDSVRAAVALNLKGKSKPKPRERAASGSPKCGVVMAEKTAAKTATKAASPTANEGRVSPLMASRPRTFRTARGYPVTGRSSFEDHPHEISHSRRRHRCRSQSFGNRGLPQGLGGARVRRSSAPHLRHP